MTIHTRQTIAQPDTLYQGLVWLDRWDMKYSGRVTRGYRAVRDVYFAELQDVLLTEKMSGCYLRRCCWTFFQVVNVYNALGKKTKYLFFYTTDGTGETSLFYFFPHIIHNIMLPSMLNGVFSSFFSNKMYHSMIYSAYSRPRTWP